MTEDEQFFVDRLKSRLTNERKQVAITLLSELKNLHVRTKNAIEALQEGQLLDAHLIVNASGITESIARWNLVCDLLPYLSPQIAKIVEEKAAKESKKEDGSERETCKLCTAPVVRDGYCKRHQ